MDHSPTDDSAAEVRLLITAADLALLLGATLNELVELHLAREQVPGTPPVSDEDGPGEATRPAEGPSLGSVRRLELVRRIRAELETLWPKNPHRQASWLRGYLRPRGHDGISLGNVDDDLLISTYDAVRMLVDRLRETDAQGPHVAAVEDMRAGAQS